MISMSYNKKSDNENNDWIELMGPDISMKKLRHGTGETTAEVGTIVTCSLQIYKEPFDVPIETSERESFLIGEGDGVPGLELGLRHSVVGDKLRIRCASKFGYGSTGRTSFDTFPAIEPNTNLVFETEILEHKIKCSSGNAVLDTLEYITQRKESGNRWFKYGEFLRAGRCYSKGAQEAEKVFDFSDDDPNQLQLKIVYLTCLNNLAACHLSMSEFFKAKEVCLQLLNIDPDNSKGLLRGAKASLALHDYEECEACLTHLLRLEPDNEAGKKEWVKLVAARRNYKERTKAMSRNMAKHLFGGSSNASGDSEGTSTSTSICDGGIQDSTSSNTDSKVPSEDIGSSSRSSVTSQKNDTKKKESNTADGHVINERIVTTSDTSTSSRQWVGLLVTSLLTLVVSVAIGYYIYIFEK